MVGMFGRKRADKPSNGDNVDLKESLTGAIVGVIPSKKAERTKLSAEVQRDYGQPTET